MRNSISTTAAVVFGAVAAFSLPALADGMDKGKGGAADASTEATQSVTSFTGFDATRNSNYVYQGFIAALNQNLDKDGFLLRTYGGFVNYRYSLDTVTGGKVNGDGWQGDVMLGYQWVRQMYTLSAFIGGDYQNYRLTPDDPTARIRGTEFGFKVAADVESNEASPFYYSLGGAYSTAFNTYWSRARVGVTVRPTVFIGPEFIAYGGDGYDDQRLGGFVKFEVPMTRTVPLEITLSGGHQWSRDGGSSGSTTAGGPGGDNGVYGALDLSFTF